MIASISGKITAKAGDRVVIETGGLGYEIFTTAADLATLKEGSQGQLWIYEQIREDLHNLYGFASPESRDFFISLISVNGVGPKVAMAILAAATLSQLQRAVVSGDPELLKGVAGVGKKTAERIIIELKGKVGGLESVSSTLSSDSAYQALLGLGYSAGQASEAVAKLPADITDDSARVKAALKELSR